MLLREHFLLKKICLFTILMAMLILQTKQLLVYLPVLAVSGIAGGVLTGLAAALLIRRIPE